MKPAGTRGGYPLSDIRYPLTDAPRRSRLTPE